MKTLVSHSIPFKEIMKDLASDMETVYYRNCEEYYLQIPPEYGEGIIRGINFEEGIGLMMYDCLFYEDVEIRFILNEVHPLKFMFCSEGSFEHYFEGIEDRHLVEELESIVIASKAGQGHILRFKANQKTKVNNLEINRKRFYKGMDCEIGKLSADLKRLFEDVAGKELFYHHANYSLKTADAFEAIEQFQEPTFPRNLLIHSETYNIFYYQLLSYQDSQADEGNQSVLLRHELNMIHKAVELIETDLLNYGTVEKLSREVGLNPNKLQNGFKELYSLTVNNYVGEKRIAQALVLIRNTDLSFSEIADRIGLNSKSYFSKIFKDKYGLTPSQIRKNSKSSKVQPNIEKEPEQ